MAKEKKNAENGFRTSIGERASYGFYFMGQNIFYMLISMFLLAYFTDMAIPAAAVAVITLIVKGWDAVNDPIFGGMVDRIRFKKGKFVPWLRISLVAIPAATVFLFAMRPEMALGLKIGWAALAYILWDLAYTICDVPIFGLVTTITDNLHERTVFIAIGRALGIAAAILVAVLIGTVRQALGGWFGATLVLSAAGLIAMIPICFAARERVVPEAGEKDIGIKEMFRFIVKNKYLLIIYGAAIIFRGFSIDAGLGMYIARYNLHNESFIAINTVLSIVPMMVVSASVPFLVKKFDKFSMFFWGSVACIIINIVYYFVGYSNITAYLVMLLIRSFATSVVFSLLFFFTPDCAEYGRYKTGISAPGISFSLQTFSVKMIAAIGTAAAAAALSAIGFVEGENAVQAAGFEDKLWAANIWIPTIAGILSIPILLQYRLRDKYVKIITDCNNGLITREAAEKELEGKL